MFYDVPSETRAGSIPSVVGELNRRRSYFSRITLCVSFVGFRHFLFPILPQLKYLLPTQLVYSDSTRSDPLIVLFGIDYCALETVADRA